MNSPWGKVQEKKRFEEIKDEEVYFVSTSSHGGLVVKKNSVIQNKIEEKYGQSKLYTQWVQTIGSNVFYEEDCACLLVLSTVNPDKYEEQLKRWL